MERRLYFISDIHLELCDISSEINFELDEKYDNYLALCGDIGCPFERNYEKFIYDQSKKFKRVFVITGNHEYYNNIPYQTEGIFSDMVNINYRTMHKIENKIKQICEKLPNVTFLTNEPFNLDDTLFVGCTLWTEVDENAEKYMNDYKKIFIDISHNEISVFKGNIDTPCFDQRKIKYMDILQLYGEMKTYLEEQIKKKDGKQIIVLTHHAPSFQMTRQDTRSIYYASNCESLFAPPLKYWISGHTHECKTIEINNVTCLSNCVGYKTEKTGFDINKFVTF